MDYAVLILDLSYIGDRKVNYYLEWGFQLSGPRKREPILIVERVCSKTIKV